jgi:hypothetical protein
MIKTNAILILKTFSDEEIKLFEDFLNSPFHNKNTKVIKFFNLLIRYHPDYKDEEISKENLFKELFGKSKFKESYIRNLFSDLNILAERFLQCIHVTNNLTFDKLLLEEMKSRDLVELIRKKINTFEKNLFSPGNVEMRIFMRTNFLFII